MILFEVYYSRPDIANAVRELPKVNNSANHACYKQMLRAVRYLLHTRNRMLKFILETNGEKWELKDVLYLQKFG